MAKQTDNTKTAKRELAQRLYIDSNYTQEEVAEIIGVTRQTIIRWAKTYHWQELRAATSVSPAEQIRQLRQQIANINEAILARPIAERWATPAGCAHPTPSELRISATSLTPTYKMSQEGQKDEDRGKKSLSAVVGVPPRDAE